MQSQAAGAQQINETLVHSECRRQTAESLRSPTSTISS